MKVNHKLTLIFLFGLLLLACQETELQTQTKTFSNYLATNNTAIKKDHFYILIPSGSCKGCSKIAFEKITSLLKINHIINITFITSNQLYSKEIPNKLCIYDSLKNLDLLNLHLGNLNIIHTKDYQIQANIEISSTNMPIIDSLFGKAFN